MTCIRKFCSEQLFVTWNSSNTVADVLFHHSDISGVHLGAPKELRSEGQTFWWSTVTPPISTPSVHWSAPTGRGVGMTALQRASSYCWTGRGHSAGDGTGCWHRALNQKLREPFGFSHPLVEKHFFCLSEVQVSSEQTQGFLHRAALWGQKQSSKHWASWGCSEPSLLSLCNSSLLTSRGCVAVPHPSHTQGLEIENDYSKNKTRCH